jgi:hypothetical protein
VIRGLVVAALVAAVAGGNLLVTTTEHPMVWRTVRVLMTGEVRGKGTLYVYRNLDGVKCGNSRDDQEALGRRARELMKPLRVEAGFDAEASYVPARFGVRESVCAYLYTDEQSTGLPPDAGYSDSEVRVRFAVPPGWKASPRHGRAVLLAAIRGNRYRVRASGACAGRAWRIESVPVRKDGSFSATNGIVRVTGRFRGRVTGAGAVRARVSGPGCPLAAIRLTGRAPVPASR